MIDDAEEEEDDDDDKLFPEDFLRTVMQRERHVLTFHRWQLKTNGPHFFLYVSKGNVYGISEVFEIQPAPMVRVIVHLSIENRVSSHCLKQVFLIIDTVRLACICQDSVDSLYCSLLHD